MYCPIWIFIVDTHEDQINSAAIIQQKLGIGNRHSKKNAAPPPSQEDK